MTYLKKNKLIIFFFILGILQILYYWSERSNFKLQILSNPFKKNSYLSYILPERIIETRKILISNDINKFNLSTKLRNEMYFFQRVIELNYPSRFDPKSKYILVSLEENLNCESIFKGEYIELQKCP